LTNFSTKTAFSDAFRHAVLGALAEIQAEAVDKKSFGMIPRTPQDPMQKAVPTADERKKPARKNGTRAKDKVLSARL
jgi:hypothetical protein